MTHPQQQSDGPSGDLAGYEVIVAVCGGIAAYKVCTVVSSLVQRRCGVTVAMTEAATHLVGPATFQALTGRQVFTSIWQAETSFDPQHIKMTDAADLIVVAPATANMLGKIVGGIADDVVSTIIMSADCPVMLAPAMNTRMWNNRFVQANVAKLREAGYPILEPGTGWLACKSVGAGRMAEPEMILAATAERLLARPPKAVSV